MADPPSASGSAGGIDSGHGYEVGAEIVVPGVEEEVFFGFIVEVGLVEQELHAKDAGVEVDGGPGVAPGDGGMGDAEVFTGSLGIATAICMAAWGRVRGRWDEPHRRGSWML